MQVVNIPGLICVFSLRSVNRITECFLILVQAQAAQIGSMCTRPGDFIDSLFQVEMKTQIKKRVNKTLPTFYLLLLGVY